MNRKERLAYLKLFCSLSPSVLAFKTKRAMAVPVSKNDGRMRKDIKLREVFYGRSIGQQVHVGIRGIFFYTQGIVKDTFFRSIEWLSSLAATNFRVNTHIIQPGAPSHNFGTSFAIPRGWSSTKSPLVPMDIFRDIGGRKATDRCIITGGLK